MGRLLAAAAAAVLVDKLLLLLLLDFESLQPGWTWKNMLSRIPVANVNKRRAVVILIFNRKVQLHFSEHLKGISSQLVLSTCAEDCVSSRSIF